MQRIFPFQSRMFVVGNSPLSVTGFAGSAPVKGSKCVYNC